MNIQESWLNIKNLFDDMLSEWGVLLLVFILSIASFGLGRLSAQEEVRPSVSVYEAESASATHALTIGGQVVASRTGTAYFFPWCGGADRVAMQNKVWFSSEEAARKAGFRPAKNCKGLE